MQMYFGSFFVSTKNVLCTTVWQVTDSPTDDVLIAVVTVNFRNSNVIRKWRAWLNFTQLYLLHMNLDYCVINSMQLIQNSLAEINSIFVIQLYVKCLPFYLIFLCVSCQFELLLCSLTGRYHIATKHSFKAFPSMYHHVSF